jgi:hypothetical protein
MGGRTLFVFRAEEPFSAWVAVFAGPLSTLPAVAVALFSRRWAAGWLIAGGLVSLGALVAGERTRTYTTAELSEMAVSFAIMFTVPMISLGLGLLWVQRHLELTSPVTKQSRLDRRALGGIAVIVGYLLLSVGAFFMADVPIFYRAFDTALGFWIMPPILGPLALLATMRLIGVPLYAVASVVIFGLLWLATTHEDARRPALIGAVAVWILSGLFLLGIAVGFG